MKNQSLTLDLFAEPAQPPAPERVLLPRPMLQTVPPFSPFQSAEAVEWELARTAFGHAVRAAGRDAEVLTYSDFVSAVPGRLDHRKLARLANSLLGRVASDRPEPTTQEWRDAACLLKN